MATIVGIQFQKNGKIYNFDVNNLEVKPDDYVVADTGHGIDLGQVVVGCRHVEDTDSAVAQKKLIRIATEKDLQTSAENREKEREAFTVCQKKIAEHKLDMKLVSVEYAFDNSKALFYFTANGRVDFRSLVKDLASVFKMRIELRQIGVRDEARMIGGLGPCGRQICCGSFLDEFQPVSIKMAKEQNLSLNPTKISGVCGRLMCCLKYEQDHYEQTRKIMPRIGKEVSTPDGTGTVSDLNIVKETVFVRITNGDSSEIKEYPLEKVERINSSEIHQTADRKENAANGEVHPEGAPEAETGNDSKGKGNPQRENRGKKGQNNPSGQNRNQRKPEKQETAKKNPALGKPVMRENPNRNVPKQETAPAVEAAEEKTEVSSGSNWAEAVLKAIDSIN
jgi:cell fate regulator YaaT (PSP1 superfamily)